MKASHKAVMELFSDSDLEPRERFAQVSARHSMSEDALAAAYEEVFSGNDVEGAAIGIAAVDLAYPDHDAAEYFEARSRVLNQMCPLLRLQGEPGFHPQFEREAEEMLDIILDGAERLAAGFPLAI
jgi:hypothetical protein